VTGFKKGTRQQINGGGLFVGEPNRQVQLGVTGAMDTNIHPHDCERGEGREGVFLTERKGEKRRKIEMGPGSRG